MCDNSQISISCEHDKQIQLSAKYGLAVWIRVFKRFFCNNLVLPLLPCYAIVMLWYVTCSRSQRVVCIRECVLHHTLVCLITVLANGAINLLLARSIYLFWLASVVLILCHRTPNRTASSLIHGVHLHVIHLCTRLWYGCIVRGYSSGTDVKFTLLNAVFTL